MYLNEKSWAEQQENPYVIDCKIRAFLDVYKTIKKKYPRQEVYVAEDEKLYLRSKEYPLEKWMATADTEYRRLYQSFWGKRIVYCPEDEYEICIGEEKLNGGTEAYLNDSFMLSIGLSERWEQETITGTLNSVYEEEKKVSITNLFCEEQVERGFIKEKLEQGKIIQVAAYDELWSRRKEFFPHLCFCPSVKDDLDGLECFYLNQIVKKLTELEEYCIRSPKTGFDASLLTKTTPETDETIKKYRKEHTFFDEEGEAYIASWHMRFTGIPRRIFFIPEYREASILICYIGKKLKNVSYPT